MKTMHWLGVITTTLISLNVLTACSGDDAPPAPGSTGGTTGAGGSGTAGTGTAGTGTAGGTGGLTCPPATALKGTAAYVMLTGADATAGAAAPGAWDTGGCKTCHGPNGEGFDPVFPEIRFTPTEYLKATVRGGRKDANGDATGMLAYDASVISDADLDTVATWLQGLPKPTTPEGLYKAMCGNCHGPKMATGGGSPINISCGVSSANVDKYVRQGSGTIANYNDRKTYMPAFSTTLLTEAELTQIKTFIGAK